MTTLGFLIPENQMNDGKKERFQKALYDFRGKITTSHMAFIEAVDAMNLLISSGYISVDQTTGAATMASDINDTVIQSHSKLKDLTVQEVLDAFEQLTQVNVAYTGTPVDRTPRDKIMKFLDI